MFEYPCGYRSDYRFDTAEQAKFFDDFDELMATKRNASFDTVLSWLEECFANYHDPLEEEAER